MLNKLRRTLIAAGVLPLFACSAGGAPPSQAVVIARDVALVLPAAADLGRPVEAMQMVSVRRQGETHVFEARLSVDGQRLLLVGTDSLGRRAMTIEWRGEVVIMDKAPWVPDALRPENILADIVLLYWPEAVVARSLRGATVSGDVSGRHIGEAIRISWDGDPWNGRSRLLNQSFGYELDIRSVTVPR